MFSNYLQLNDRLNAVAEDTRINEENVKMIDSLLRQVQDKLGTYEIDGISQDGVLARDRIRYV